MIQNGGFVRADPVNPIPESGVKYRVFVSGGERAYFYVRSAKGMQIGMGRLKRPADRLHCHQARLTAPPKAALPFYHSPAWLAKRKALIAQRGAWCEICGAGGRLHLDHKVEVRDGGELLDDTNLQLLCQPCHNRKTAQVKAARSGS